MKKESFLKKIGKAAVLSAGLLIGAQNAEAGKEEMFNEMDNTPANDVHKHHKQSLPSEEKKINKGDMFEAMDELGVLDSKYMAFKHLLKSEGKKDEGKKDEMRQEIARTALMSGKSKEILSQKGGQIFDMRIGNGYWIINAQSDGAVVTGSIVSRNEREKSMIAFTLR